MVWKKESLDENSTEKRFLLKNIKFNPWIENILKEIEKAFKKGYKGDKYWKSKSRSN